MIYLVFLSLPRVDVEGAGERPDSTRVFASHKNFLLPPPKPLRPRPLSFTKKVLKAAECGSLRVAKESGLFSLRLARSRNPFTSKAIVNALRIPCTKVICLKRRTVSALSVWERNGLTLSVSDTQINIKLRGCVVGATVGDSNGCDTSETPWRYTRHLRPRTRDQLPWKLGEDSIKMFETVSVVWIHFTFFFPPFLSIFFFLSSSLKSNF